MALSMGTRAPDFEGKTDEGSQIRLYEVLNSGPVVLYFYPKDETPGCTKEACTFRDNWDEIRELGGTVLGVSSDSVESHKSFKEHRKSQCALVSDPLGKIRSMLQAKEDLIPDRITYVIDTDGTIKHVYKSQLNASRHADEAINALKVLKPEK